MILYNFLFISCLSAHSVNTPLIFENLKYKTSVARKYLPKAANRNFLRLLVLSNSVINFLMEFFENQSPSPFLNGGGPKKLDEHVVT